jgi:hypothetical protein
LLFSVFVERGGVREGKERKKQKENNWRRVQIVKYLITKSVKFPNFWISTPMWRLSKFLLVALCSSEFP